MEKGTSGQVVAPREEEEFEFRLRAEREAKSKTDQTASSSGIGEKLGSMAKQSALPISLSYAGGKLGSGIGAGLAGPAGIIPGEIIGESLGGGLGEGLNQLAGITPPSLTNIGANMAITPLTRGVIHGIKQLPRLLPGASAALQQQGVEVARHIPKTLPIPTASKTLFEQVDNLAASTQQKMRFPNTKTVVDELTLEEVNALKGLQDVPLVKRLSHMGEGLDKGLTFEQFDKTIRNLGKKIGTTDDRALKGTYKSVYKSLLKDVDDMPPPSGVPLPEWKEARRVWGREAAQRDLTEVIEGAITKSGEYLDTINANKIGNWLKGKDAELFRRSVSSEELASIETTLKELSRIPKVPVARGAAIGSGRRIGGILAGGAVGSHFGPTGAALGSLLVDKGQELIAQALTSDKGRVAMMRLLNASGGTFGEQQLGELALFLYSANNPTQPPPLSPSEIQPPVNPTQIQPMGLRP